jgi:hypothetical protein
MSDHELGLLLERIEAALAVLVWEGVSDQVA